MLLHVLLNIRIPSTVPVYNPLNIRTPAPYLYVSIAFACPNYKKGINIIDIKKEGRMVDSVKFFKQIMNSIRFPFYLYFPFSKEQ